MAKHQGQFDEQMYGVTETPAGTASGQQPELSDSAGDEHRKGALSTKRFQIQTFPVKTAKGLVNVLLRKRKKKRLILTRNQSRPEPCCQNCDWPNFSMEQCIDNAHATTT